MLLSIAAFLVGCFFSITAFINLGAAETIFRIQDVQGSELTSKAGGLTIISPIDVGNIDPQQQHAEQSIGPIVEIRHNRSGFQLYRHGEPYYVKGVGGTRYIEEARAAGANSIRTWSSKNIDTVLERSAKNNMTVMLGIWLSHNPADYLDDGYKMQVTKRVQRLLERHKDHPALLMWALGNEINLHGKDGHEVWQFVNTLARMIKAQDSRHPVISVISHRKETLDIIVRNAPDLDAVGINAYGSLSNVRKMVDESEYKGPYLITEWGVIGHWEAERTQWGRPIEPTSASKVALYHRFYVEDILKNKDRCLGSYVFLWGQKQERTPTWYSMFIEKIPGLEIEPLTCATVDVMGFNWSGTWPANRAPAVTALTINGITAYDDVSLFVGEEMTIQATANDPDQEPLSYIWEVLEEPVQLGVGGSRESRPASVGEVLSANSPQLLIQAPEESGFYRLFVYVLDKQGHVGTANVPFQVKGRYQAKGESAQASFF